MLQLIREGCTNAEIGERLSISAETAKYHVSEILSKLCVGTREDAAAWQPETTHVPGRTGVAGLLFGLKAFALGGSAAALAGVGVLGYGVIVSGDTLPPGDAPGASAQQEPLTIKEVMKLVDASDDIRELTDRPEFGPDYRQMTLAEALSAEPFASSSELSRAQAADPSSQVLVLHYGEFDDNTRWFDKLCAGLSLIVTIDTGELLASEYETSPCPPPPDEG